MSNEELIPIIESMQEFCEDNSLPKNIKFKINEVIAELKSDKEASIKINKALQELEEISDDTNLPQYTRPQVWNLISILESI